MKSQIKSSQLGMDETPTLPRWNRSLSACIKRHPMSELVETCLPKNVRALEMGMREAAGETKAG